MEIILESPWDYQFYKEGEDYFLAAVCGTVAVFEIAIRLNGHELAQYHQNGESYIRTLAYSIQSSPEDWISRKI